MCPVAQNERPQQTRGDSLDESVICSGRVSKEMTETYSINYESSWGHYTDYLILRPRVSQC